MKYQITTNTIPYEKRKEINEKILYILNHNINTDITKEDIYHAYTGNGSLHGLNFSDFENFYEFTEAKKQYENGQFFTPSKLSKFIIECLQPSSVDLIGDLTCGAGAFFNFLPNESNIYGCEIDANAYKVAKYLYPNANIELNDIRYYQPHVSLDIVIGNPPYNLKWNVNGKEYLSQWYYLLKSYQLLKPSGLLVLIVPKSFLNDDFRDGNLIKEVNNLFSFVVQFELPKESFKQYGVENFETKVIIFQKKSLYLKEIPYQVEYIESPTINELGAKKIYKEYIHELLKSKNEIRAKLLFEAIKNNPTDNNFEYKVKKLLFDIKRNPKLQHYLGKAEDYIHKYYSQTKPEDIDWTEWNRVKITEKKVISYLKNVIKKQHEKELDVIKLVKDRYGLKYKAYSHKAKIRLNKYNKPTFIAFADIVQNDIKDFANSPYRKLIKRKLLEYKKQIKPYAIMGKDKSVEDFLDEFYLYNYNKNQRITLNNVQRLDMSKILQKKYNIIQWECGCGKSLAGITFLKFHQTQKNIKHGIVIAPAIAIEEWTEFLSDYKIPFKNIRSLKDIESIKCGEILLITLNMVIKYQNQLKKFIKINNRKFALLFDESHTISNINSKRTKAVLNVFRRLPYKLLTSATLTKNNIAEIFPQLDLLYNSSHNFINESETIMVKNKKTNRIEKKKNQYYMKAYPPYKKGYRLFQETHNPQKITVFGAEANTQDIYSADTLQKLINRTIITRNFEEIAGRKIYAIEQKTCKMSAPEKDLYNLIINDFYKLTYRFTKIENTRKESFLKIIRQINLLIKSTSTPHLFREWTGDTYSTKFEEVASLINKYEGKQIAVGCLFIETVDSYKKFFKERYPDRPVVVITGEHTSLTQRKKIINKLKEDSMKDAILLCTQQSLSSSLNINFIDTVIIPEIYWNDPTMRQFYFRFIRLNSERDKKVYFVTYENSIESNMLQLVLAKEKLNLFMKDIIVSEDSLHKEYGIDFNILEMLLRKEWDQNGNVHLSWGTQTIAN